MSKKIEIIITLTLGIFCIVIASLDIFDLFEDNHWISERIPPLTLLGIGAIATYLIIERKNKIDELHKIMQNQSTDLPDKISAVTDNIISAINGIKVNYFQSSNEMFRYASKRYSSAKTIADVYGGGKPTKPRSQKDVEAYNNFHKTIDKIIKKEDVIFRQVCYFEYRQQYENEKKRLIESNIGYNLGFYNYNSKSSPPKISFGLIDAEEIIFSNSRRKIWFSIKHPFIVKFFEEFFNDLWDRSTEIKEGNKIYFDNQKSLEKDLLSIS
jgi:hypothetical protein